MPDQSQVKAAGRTAFIAGSTATGKTRAAILLAEQLTALGGAEIVNADSMQVYADIPILSAQPSMKERGDIPHHLFGYLSGAERCSAGRWARDAAAVIDEIHQRGRFAVVVGGTGLYFRALEQGLAETPEISQRVRAAAHKRLEDLGLEKLRAEILDFDPEMARLASNDVQRHLRAWEIYQETGRPLSELQNDDPKGGLTPGARIVIEPDREEVYRRCEERFDLMMENGALEEVCDLMSKNYAPDLPVTRALGVAELMGHLNKRLELDEAIETAKMNTRRFVKRQLTWFRNQTPDWPREKDPIAAAAFLARELEMKFT